MKIVFFNHYHNGDIFASKGYVSDLINELKGHDLYYQHFNSPKLLRDLNIEFKSLELPMANIDNRTQFFTDSSNIFINTWIGNYLQLGDGINWKTYHKMFDVIYKFLSNELDKKFDLGPIEYYIPNIKYEYFDVPDITVPKGSIIISNGPTLSGQSDLSDINSIVDFLLEKTDKHIILTHFAPITSNRISFTNNLINTTGGDLNEISWIAEQCQYIIGRNSGPFCFMNTKKILNDKSKTIISIGNNEKDSFIYDISTPVKYKFIHDSELNKVVDIVC